MLTENIDYYISNAISFTKQICQSVQRSSSYQFATKTIEEYGARLKQTSSYQWINRKILDYKHQYAEITREQTIYQVAELYAKTKFQSLSNGMQQSAMYGMMTTNATRFKEELKQSSIYKIANDTIKEYGHFFLQTNFDLVFGVGLLGAYIIFGTPSLKVVLPVLGIVMIHHCQAEAHKENKAVIIEKHQKLLDFYRIKFDEYHNLIDADFDTKETTKLLGISFDVINFYDFFVEAGEKLDENFVKNHEPLKQCVEDLTFYKKNLEQNESINFVPVKKVLLMIATILNDQINQQKEKIKLLAI